MGDCFWFCVDCCLVNGRDWVGCYCYEWDDGYGLISCRKFSEGWEYCERCWYFGWKW